MAFEERLFTIPVIRNILIILQKVRIPGLQGMSLYMVLKMYAIGIVRGALTSRASSIAFSLFLALFPFALFILTLIPYVPIHGFQADFINLIDKALPPNTAGAVDSVLNDIANNKYGGLLSFGFLTSIFLMTNGINSLFGSFEYSYHNVKTRSIIKQYFVALFISLIIAVLLFFTIGIIVFFEIFINKLNDSGIVHNEIFWVEITQSIILIIMLLSIVGLLFYFGTREGRKLKFFSAGSIMTTLLILLNFKIFGIYVIKFSKYNELYGSIGTLLIIMLFIWLNAIILLLGFELNACIIGLKKNNKLSDS